MVIYPRNRLRCLALVSDFWLYWVGGCMGWPLCRRFQSFCRGYRCNPRGAPRWSSFQTFDSSVEVVDGPAVVMAPPRAFWWFSIYTNLLTPIRNVGLASTSSGKPYQLKLQNRWLIDHVKKEKCYLYAYRIVDVLTTLVSGQAEGIALSLLLLSISYLPWLSPPKSQLWDYFCLGGNLLQTLPEARSARGEKKSLAHPKLFVQKW